MVGELVVVKRVIWGRVELVEVCRLPAFPPLQVSVVTSGVLHRVAKLTEY